MSRFPPHQKLADLAAVTDYRAKLARALKRRGERTDRQQVWLEAAIAEGLVKA